MNAAFPSLNAAFLQAEGVCNKRRSTNHDDGCFYIRVLNFRPLFDCIHFRTTVIFFSPLLMFLRTVASGVLLTSDTVESFVSAISSAMMALFKRVEWLKQDKPVMEMHLALKPYHLTMLLLLPFALGLCVFRWCCRAKDLSMDDLEEPADPNCAICSHGIDDVDHSDCKPHSGQVWTYLISAKAAKTPGKGGKQDLEEEEEEEEEEGKGTYSTYIYGEEEDEEEEEEEEEGKRTYSTYIYKVLKQVHPDLEISRKAMSIMNSHINDVFERIAGEAGRLCRYNKKATLSSREIQTASLLILPGELAKHAVSEGYKALAQPLTLHFYRWNVQSLDNIVACLELYKSWEDIQVLHLEKWHPDGDITGDIQIMLNKKKLEI
eukprot:g2566.t1